MLKTSAIKTNGAITTTCMSRKTMAEGWIRPVPLGWKMYVIIVDYFSFWSEVFLSGKPDSTNVMHAIKEAFSRYGIPQEVISDNGPLYTSREFRLSKSQWQFVHTTNSPHCPQSNGLAECAVKAVKRLIKKCP